MTTGIIYGSGCAENIPSIDAVNISTSSAPINLIRIINIACDSNIKSGTAFSVQAVFAVIFL